MAQTSTVLTCLLTYLLDSVYSNTPTLTSLPTALGFLFRGLCSSPEVCLQLGVKNRAAHDADAHCASSRMRAWSVAFASRCVLLEWHRVRICI